MRTILIFLTFLTGLLAQESKPAPTIESLTADVARLSAENAQQKREIAALQASVAAWVAMAWSTDANAAQARLDAALAQQKAMESKIKGEKK